MITQILEKSRSRKNYYRDNYRSLVKVLWFCMFIIAGEITSIMLVSIFQSPSRYFATSSNGNLEQIYTGKWGAKIIQPPQTPQNVVEPSAPPPLAPPSSSAAAAT